MKTTGHASWNWRRVPLRLVGAAAFIIATSVWATAQSLPQVTLDADSVSPRAMEDLTKTTITRHYALAWRELESALASGKATGLGDEFVGFAKTHLLQRVAEQKRAGLHVQIVDHGHHLKAIYYSTDGTAMQIVDRTQLEIRAFDGDKLLDTENAPHEYVVLMTPGADRWYVRDLEEVAPKSF